VLRAGGRKGGEQNEACAQRFLHSSLPPPHWSSPAKAGDPVITASHCLREPNNSKPWCVLDAPLWRGMTALSNSDHAAARSSPGASGSFTGCLRLADKSSALVSIRRLCA